MPRSRPAARLAPRSRHVAGLVLALLGPSTAARAATPWEELMGRKPQVWSDPAGRFQIDLPLGWEARAPEGAQTVQFVRTDLDTGLAAQVEVEIRTLPPGIAARHLEAQVQAEVARAAPGYRVVERSKRRMAGVTARQTLFTYRALGNAELAREVVQLVLVLGERGYVITFETVPGGRDRFGEELRLMLDGFGVGGPAADSTLREGGRRKRIRAGEMIHPDAVGY